MNRPPSSSEQSEPKTVVPTPSKELALAAKVDNLLDSVLEPLDVIGKRLLGELWRTLYLTVQDAIALSLLLQIPNWVGTRILGKSYSALDICFQESLWGVDRYACFIIVISDFLLWILLAGRIMGRFIADFRKLFPRREAR